MATSAYPVSSSQTRKSEKRIAQNYLLIWLDSNINETDSHSKNVLEHLSGIVNDITICKELVQCINCLRTINDEKAFIISSGTLGQQLVSLIHGMQKVDAIYIFCGNKEKHEEWVKKWPKIKGVFTTIKPLCESLKQVAHQCDHNAIAMSFVSKQTISDTASTDQNSLVQLEPLFMYSVLFKEIILEIDDEDDTKSVKDLVAYCRQQKVPESQLNQFQREYADHSPIRWYTMEIFLYSMLNRALRDFNTEAMIRMAFFIGRLHRQLEQLRKEQSSTSESKFVVYRGQGLTKQHFKYLLDIKGGLLSFNSFLSTSKKQELAMNFVQQALLDKQIVGILFIMTIDSTSTIPFALIDDYSAIPQEKEILFSMHTVFRVGDIRQSSTNDRLWEVQLTLTDDNDPQLDSLTKYIRKEMPEVLPGWYRLGELMLRMNNFDQTEILYNELLKGHEDGEDRITAYIYHQLGYLKVDQGKYKEAASFYGKSLEIKRKTMKEDNPSLAGTLNNISGLYTKIGDYAKALELLEESHKILTAALPSDDPKLAASYNNIGGVYHEMGDYLKAIQFYEKSIKMREIALPANHPDLAISYSNIAHVYADLGGYSKALPFLEKVLAIRQKSLPPTHPDIQDAMYGIEYMKNKM